MIEFIQGNILQAKTEAIVNTVNCVGVMGRGIALQFKKSWPDNFAAYASACKKGEVVPGKMFIYKTNQISNPKYIINFPTKRHWRMNSRMEDIEAGLLSLAKDIYRLNIKSISIPPLGAGLGGLDWREVRIKIESYLQDLSLKDVRILIYEPLASPITNKDNKIPREPKMTAGRAVLIEIIQRYLSGLLDPSITLLEIHKLMYFMQEAGEPLRLNFVKAHYGPYASNLRHVLNLIEGHFITGYQDGGDDPAKEISLLPGAIEKAREALSKNSETQQRFNRVATLIEGFESAIGLELLTTVHWLNIHENRNTIESIQDGFYNWNMHKRQFSERQIRIAAQFLQKRGWITL